MVVQVAHPAAPSFSGPAGARCAHPLGVVVAVEIDVREREVVRRARPDAIPGSRNGLLAQHRGAAPLSAGAARVSCGPACLQGLDHRPGDRHPVPVVDVGRLGRRRVLLQDLAVERGRRDPSPRRVVRVLDERDRQIAPSSARARSPSRNRHDRPARSRRRRSRAAGFQPSLCAATIALDRELRGREQHRACRPRTPSASRSGRRRRLPCTRSDSEATIRGPFAGDCARESARHVLAEVGVLEQDRDPRRRPRLGERASVDRALAAVALQEPHRPRVRRGAARVHPSRRRRRAAAPSGALR